MVLLFLSFIGHLRISDSVISDSVIRNIIYCEVNNFCPVSVLFPTLSFYLSLLRFHSFSRILHPLNSSHPHYSLRPTDLGDNRKRRQRKIGDNVTHYSLPFFSFLSNFFSNVFLSQTYYFISFLFTSLTLFPL